MNTNLIQFLQKLSLYKSVENPMAEIEVKKFLALDLTLFAVAGLGYTSFFLYILSTLVFSIFQDKFFFNYYWLFSSIILTVFPLRIAFLKKRTFFHKAVNSINTTEAIKEIFSLVQQEPELQKKMPDYLNLYDQSTKALAKGDKKILTNSVRLVLSQLVEFIYQEKVIVPPPETQEEKEARLRAELNGETLVSKAQNDNDIVLPTTLLNQTQNNQAPTAEALYLYQK